jgi:hypothetical protein
MANTPVLGSGPVEFVDLVDQPGKEWIIPLSLLGYDANGQIVLDAAIPAGLQNQLKPWLKTLQDQGVIKPGSTPSAPPPPLAMVINGVDKGAAGNQIQVQFSKVDTGAGTFSAQVSALVTYQNVAPDKLTGLIGTSAGGGSSPCLVYVSSAGPPTLPAAIDSNLQGPGPTFTLDVPAQGGGGNAFTLHDKQDVPAAADTHVTVSAVDAGKKTFTLAVGWQLSKDGLTPANFQTDADFKYVIAVQNGDGGKVGMPTNSTVVLTGGQDPATATANVFGPSA